MAENNRRIRAGIIGATGYTGHELVKLLTKHRNVELVVLNSESSAGKKVSELYPDFKADIKYTGHSIDQINDLKLDVVFLALPHTVAMDWAPKLNSRVIDLSADYRFKDPKEYERVYGLEHKDPAAKAVYGLPELFEDQIKPAKLIANPGCYATGMILSGYPLRDKAEYMVFDCKSGWSGAGKGSRYAKDASISKDNLIPYSLTTHRHKYEVQQFLGKRMSFTPHVIDTFRGMMITGHILLKEPTGAEEIKKSYKEFYKDARFVEVVDGTPDLHLVQNTNDLIIGGFEVDENNQLLVVAVLDNLLKGASGQAVQNMNIMFGFDQAEGLGILME